MIFLNYIKFRHGKLQRGERCLWRGYHAVYLGSYVENGHTVYMLRVDKMYGISGLPVLEEYIAQCTDKKEITCIKQQEPAIEGQLQLC